MVKGAKTAKGGFGGSSVLRSFECQRFPLLRYFETPATVTGRLLLNEQSLELRLATLRERREGQRRLHFSELTPVDEMQG